LYCESAHLSEQRRKVNLKTSRSKSRRHANLRKKKRRVGRENDTTREKAKKFPLDECHGCGCHLNMSKPKNPLIVALDFDDPDSALRCARSLRGLVGMFKIGLELFCRTGTEFVRKIADDCGPVFLDLKFHDIPNTVAGAVRSASTAGVEFLTVHTCGGSEMLRAALESAAEASQGRVRVLGVTVLTSLNDADLVSVGVRDSAAEQALRLASLGVGAGLDGFVCSPVEVAHLRAAVGKEKILVTPGIRPAGSQSGDQKRTTTPREALQAGADYIVVGRPITRACDPCAAASTIIQEMSDVS